MVFETETANTVAIEQVIREVKLYLMRAFRMHLPYNNSFVHEVIERIPDGHEWMFWRECDNVYMAKRWEDLQGLGIMAKSFKELVWRVAYRQILAVDDE